MDHDRRSIAKASTGCAALVVSLLWFSCAPGSLPCSSDDEWRAICKGNAGSGGSGGSGGDAQGGSGGGTGGGAPDMAQNIPFECKTYATATEVEEKLIMPRCGKPGGPCHATTFPPKFTKLEEVAPALSNFTSTLCRGDKGVNKADPMKSIVITKINAPAPPGTAACPSGGNTGGGRMPYIPDEPLTKDEADCLSWWVFKVAQQ